MSDSLRYHGHVFSSPWNSLSQNTGVGSLSLLQVIFPAQRLNPGFLQFGQILYELSHKGKPQNTAVGSLSLLQWIFPTQELNQGLLHCRQILYQLSYQESPVKKYAKSIFPHPSQIQEVGQSCCHPCTGEESAVHRRGIITLP